MSANWTPSSKLMLAPQIRTIIDNLPFSIKEKLTTTARAFEHHHPPRPNRYHLTSLRVPPHPLILFPYTKFTKTRNENVLTRIQGFVWRFREGIQQSQRISVSRGHTDCKYREWFCLLWGSWLVLQWGSVRLIIGVWLKCGWEFIAKDLFCQEI